MGSPIKKPATTFENKSNRPAAVKATKKAIKGAVSLSRANELARNPSSEKDMDTAFSLRSSAAKAVKNANINGISKSPNKLNDVMKKRIVQSKKSRGK
jgi:hypothetical protein